MSGPRILLSEHEGTGKFRVRVGLGRNVYEYALTGSRFARQNAAEAAAIRLARRSYTFLYAGAAIRTALDLPSAFADQRGMRIIGSSEREWLSVAEAAEEIAMSATSHIGPFTTGSDGVQYSDVESADVQVSGVVSSLMRRAPRTFGSEESFINRWRGAVSRHRPDTRLLLIQGRINRIGVARTMIARDPDLDSALRREVLADATAHIPGVVPTAPPEPIIRGDRATSLLNMLVPRISSQIEQVSDPDVRDAFRSRLARMGDAVRIAGERRSEAALTHDIEMSLQALDEQIERHAFSIRARRAEEGPSIPEFPG